MSRATCRHCQSHSLLSISLKMECFNSALPNCSLKACSVILQTTALQVIQAAQTGHHKAVCHASEDCLVKCKVPTAAPATPRKTHSPWEAEIVVAAAEHSVHQRPRLKIDSGQSFAAFKQRMIEFLKATSAKCVFPSIAWAPSKTAGKPPSKKANQPASKMLGQNQVC